MWTNYFVYSYLNPIGSFSFVTYSDGVIEYLVVFKWKCENKPYVFNYLCLSMVRNIFTFVIRNQFIPVWINKPLCRQNTEPVLYLCFIQRVPSIITSLQKTILHISYNFNNKPFNLKEWVAVYCVIISQYGVHVSHNCKSISPAAQAELVGQFRENSDHGL